MLASDIVSRVRTVLLDAAGTRWADAELFTWIADGQRLITLIRPDASSSNQSHTLVAGSKQTLPSDCFRLLDVIRNLDASTGAPGRIVRYVERETIDAQDYAWHTKAQADAVINWMYDNRDPLNFYVYPPIKVGKRLEVLVSKNPPEITTGSQALAISDIYAEPLLNYVLFRAYSKDAEFAANADLARGYMSLFNAMMGIKAGKDWAFSPDATKKGAEPNINAVKAGGV